MLSWTVRWLPQPLLPLVRTARLLRLELEWTDIRPRYNVQSEFTWAKLGALLFRALRSRRVALPDARVSGRTTLRFQDGLVASVSEALELGPEFRAGRVRNRRVAKDHADFLAEWRSPPGVGVAAWESSVRDALCLRDVPGMGPLDVDGVQSEQLELSAASLGLVTLLMLAFGVSALQLRAADARERTAPWAAEADDEAGARLRSRRLLAATARRERRGGEEGPGGG